MKRASGYFTHVAHFMPEWLAASHIFVLSIIPLTITSTNNFKSGRRIDQTFGFFNGTMDKTLIKYRTILKDLFSCYTLNVYLVRLEVAYFDG